MQDDLQITANDRVTQLSPAKRALLEARLKKRAGTAVRIPPRPAEAPPPLSFAQERLWFLDQLEPGSAEFNTLRNARLTGPLDVAALERSLNAIVARHETLRATFPAVEGEPAQVIIPELTLPLPVIDISALPAEEREAQADALIREEAFHPFNPATGPLLRASLVKLATEEHLLLLTIHHLIFDGWSAPVFFQELAALYTAEVTNQPTNLPELPIQYADYASWQRQQLQGERLEALLAYWQPRLEDAPELDLPLDHPRLPDSGYQGAGCSQTLPPAVSEGIRSLCREGNLTPFMVLFTAFATLLHRYTGQEDLVIGTPIAARTHPELEGLLGLFANTLVLRADLAGDPTVRELLARVREMAVGAYAHQELPFERLVEAVRPNRAAGAVPFLRALVNFRNVPSRAMELPGLRLERRLRDEDCLARCDLGLDIVEDGGDYTVTLMYHTALCEPDTIARLLGHYLRLVGEFVADPDRQISTLPLLSEEERRLLLTEWHTVRTAYPRDACLHELVAAHAVERPDAVALICGDEQVSYREMDKRANRLAHHLQHLGVGPDVPVGICLERGCAMLISLLAILKAGGAYVPLDPAYPPERLTMMIEDTGMPVLVIQHSLLASLPATAIRLVNLDEDADAIAAQPDTAPPCAATAESLAYIAYTSGSTGRPKGVAVMHRGVVRQVVETNYVDFQPADTVLFFASLSFDLSAFEIWGALLNGATLAIATTSRLTLEELGTLLTTHHVTMMALTVSLFNAMADHHLRALAGVRFLSVCGEALSVPHIRRAMAGLPNCRLNNGYGPTENSVATCCFSIPPGFHFDFTVPIGPPIANTTVYVLDRHRQLVPVGAIGELYTGGDGLARGYVNAPELTAERFVPHPFSDDPAARLYRTGDLVRFLPGGILEFRGRVDDQLKVRGFRIEPGEVEAALRTHPAVQDCAVMAREDTPGEKRLVAYVVPRDREACATLRAFLQGTLPAYLVPSAIVLLEALPTTASHKVDRSALPAPESVETDRGEAYQPPRDALELQLTRIWEELLGVSPIGIHDNFFDLGGYSLLAVRLFARVTKVCGVSLPLISLFDAPTIAAMAELLRQQGWHSPWTALAPVQTGGTKPPLFVVTAPRQSALALRELSVRLGPDQPLYALQQPGIEGYGTLCNSYEEMAERYLAEMRSVQPEGPYYLAGVSSGGMIAYETARQLLAHGQQVALLGLFDTSTRFEHTLAVRAEFYRARLQQYDRRQRLRYLATKLWEGLTAPFVNPRRIFLRRFGKLAVRLVYAWCRLTGATYPRLLRQWDDTLYFYKRLGMAYHLQPLPLKVTLFRAGDYQRKERAQLAEDRTMGWDQLVSEVAVHDIPGGHLLIVPPGVEVLAAKLKIVLEANSL
ncbi:MAG: non-ribosomal peptide synthetase [Armatimonadota bacterium]